MQKPDLSLEQAIDGPVCGLDEVGRGPLAGPVVAACVYIPEDKYHLPFISDIRDSKKLSEKKLLILRDQISAHFTFAIAEASPQEIDRINILQASLRAMELAFYKMMSSRAQPRDLTLLQPDQISPRPRITSGVGRDDNFQNIHALIDGNRCPKDLPCPATPVIKGDSISTSIAAASIIAKAHRDEIMKTLAREHPHYGWESNVGYPAPAHLAGIDAHGITPHHRKSFAPVKNFIAFGSTAKQA